MPTEIITKEDLVEFRNLLLADIEILLKERPALEPKKWLKSYQVKNLLKISPDTIQNLRVNGSLPYTKIGGIIYYKHEDVIALLTGK